jgi:hypothetical protein
MKKNVYCRNHRLIKEAEHPEVKQFYQETFEMENEKRRCYYWKCTQWVEGDKK